MTEIRLPVLLALILAVHSSDLAIGTTLAVGIPAVTVLGMVAIAAPAIHVTVMSKKFALLLKLKLDASLTN